MHRSTETKRSSQPARKPILLTGPGGSYVDAQFVCGTQIVHMPTPVSGVPMLKMPASSSVVNTPEPWQWTPFCKAIALGMLSALGLLAICVATPVALVVAPLLYGAHHAR